MFYLERDILYSQWKMAIDRSLGWEPVTDTNGTFSFWSQNLILLIYLKRYVILQTIQRISTKQLLLVFL